MRKTSFVAVGVAALVLAVVATACAGDDDGADTAATEATADDVVSHAATETPDEILDYWTPQREADATPLEIEVEGDPPEIERSTQAGPYSVPDAAGAEGSSPGAGNVSAPQGGSASGDEFGQPVGAAATPTSPNWRIYAGSTTKLPFRQVGVLFFYDPIAREDYTCSAAVVHTPNRSTVWTAGHCVHTGKGAWMTNVRFAPGYRGGSKPYGEWPAVQLFSSNGWINGGGRGWTHDFGAVVVSRRGGQFLEDVVGGGQGVVWNPSQVPQLVDLGYPANPTSVFNFNRGPYTCGSRVVDRGAGEPRPFAIDCYFGEGASGGPWIIDYQPSRGWGYILSVNSHGYPSSRTYYYGSYPGNAVKNLYQSAKG